MRPRTLILVALAAGCGSTIVEPDPVPADYETWYRIDAVGPVPGHGDSYRIIYANDVAREKGTVDDQYVYTYKPGSIIVKEVRERDGDQPGAINYVAVMRMLNDVDTPDGAELAPLTEIYNYGWLFTYLADDIGSDEEYRSSCWDECHAAAPYAGAFYDYGQ